MDKSTLKKPAFLSGRLHFIGEFLIAHRACLMIFCPGQQVKDIRYLETMINVSNGASRRLFKGFLKDAT
jgi:hypothetical protein